MRYRWLRYRYAETVSRSGPQLLIGDLWSLQLPVTLAQPQWRPSTDLYETPTALIVKIELAGMNEEDFEITLYDDTLVISGTREWQLPEDKTQFHVVEVHYGPFQIEVPLQVAIDREGVEARYDRGFLYITLQKAEVQAP